MTLNSNMLQVTAEESQAAFNELLSTDEVVRLKFTNALLQKRVAALEADFTRVHEQLRGGANDKAADAIAALLAPGTGTQDHA